MTSLKKEPIRIFIGLGILLIVACIGYFLSVEKNDFSINQRNATTTQAAAADALVNSGKIRVKLTASNQSTNNLPPGTYIKLDDSTNLTNDRVVKKLKVGNHVVTVPALGGYTVSMAQCTYSPGSPVCKVFDADFTIQPVCTADACSAPIALKAGVITKVVVLYNTGTSTTPATSAWQSQAITKQTSDFTAAIDVTPTTPSGDTVVGLGNKKAAAFSDLAAIVRFNANNEIDARNDVNYMSAVTIPYTAGLSYHVRFVIHPTNGIYDAFVTPPNATEIPIVQGAAFRTEQASITNFTYVSTVSDIGSAVIGKVAISSAPSIPVTPVTPPTPPTTPTPPTPPTPVTPDPTPVTPPVSSGNKPGPTNTGPTNAAILKPMGGITITTPNTVLQDVSVTGTIFIKAANVTIKNFKIDADGGNYGIQVISGNVIAQDGEITNAMGGAVFGNNWTAIRLNVHDLGSDAFDGGGNNTLQDSWIHHIGMSPGAHADGIQLNNGDHIVIRGNNFDLPWWDQVGNQVYRTNSCIFLNGYVYNYLDGTIIDGNWLNGGNYSVYALGQTNTSLTNNVFGPDYQYGTINGKVAIDSGNTGE